MAKKPVISTVPQTTTNTVTINNNFSHIQEQFTNTLSLDGSTPNAMQADLDLNGNDIINAGAIFVNGEDYVVTVQNLVDTASTQATNAANSASAASSSASASASSATASAISATSAAASAAAAGVASGRFVITEFSELESKFVDADPGEGQYILPVGAIVVDEKTGNRWERVTSGAHLDYTGAGGVKFKTLLGNAGYTIDAFGAVGGGVIDDTAAFTSAALTGGYVYVPFKSGGYLVNSSVVNSGAKFFFEGPFKTQLKGTATRAQLDAVEHAARGSTDFWSHGIIVFSGGTPSLLSTSDHTPVNANAPSLVGGGYTIQYNFSQTQDDIHTFHVTPDDALAPFAMEFGISGGTDFLNITSWGAFCAFVDGTSVTRPAIFGGTGDVTATISGNRMSISHELAGTGDVPVVTNSGETPATYASPSVSYGTTTINIDNMAQMAGVASYNGTSWSIAGNNDSSAAGYAFVAPSAGGTVRLNTVARQNSICVVTSNSLTYDVVIVDLSTTSVEIAFIDRLTGLVVAATAGMSCSFMFSAHVRSTMPTGAKFSVRRGNVRVIPNRIENVPTANLQVSARGSV